MSYWRCHYKPTRRVCDSHYHMRVLLKSGHILGQAQRLGLPRLSL